MPTLGVLGAGQLGRMLALAGYPLGIQFRFLDPAADAPAAQLAEQVVASYDRSDVLDRFADGLDAVTYEFENVPEAVAKRLAGRVPVYPPPAALRVSQERVAEKTFFRDLGIPTAPFHAVTCREDLDRGLKQLGFPAVLKTCQLGYDGKGQALLRTLKDVEAAWRVIGGDSLILEGYVPFERELSAIAVRGRDGSTAFYPLTENRHAVGMLRLSLAPAPDLTDDLQRQAEDYAGRVLRELEYVGVLAIEFFQHAGKLVANEMAPRVHNSGHWTIEGAVTSQFENHVRAVLGLPLGDPSARGPCAMVNLIGTVPDAAAVLAVPGAHLHLYGKSPRPGRKLGHVTLLARDAAEQQARLDRVWALLPPDEQTLVSPSWPEPPVPTNRTVPETLAR